MVLCQDLLYNMPCTCTIDYVNNTYVVSLPMVQYAIEAIGSNVLAVVGVYFLYMLDLAYVESWDMETSNPTTYKIIRTILDNCTVSVDGGEYVSLDEAFGSLSWSKVWIDIFLAQKIVFRFPRVGISREDLANAENEPIDGVILGEEMSWEAGYSMFFLYVLLAVAGYLTPAEAYVDLTLTWEIVL